MLLFFSYSGGRILFCCPFSMQFMQYDLCINRIKNKLVLLAALLQVSSVLMSNLGCIALPLPYHYLLLYHSYTSLGNMHKTPIIQSHPTYACETDDRGQSVKK